MKTKLLKIVRKRYEIVKVEKHDQKPEYKVIDHNDSFRGTTHKSFKDAWYMLKVWIYVDYVDRNNGKRKTVKTKVWYNS